MSASVELLPPLSPIGEVRVTASRFSPGSGASEWHLSASGSRAATAADQLAELEAAYAAARDAWGLSGDSAVHRRIFVSDAVGCRDALEGSTLLASEREAVAVSVVEQPPLPGASGPALWAYHVTDDAPLEKVRLDCGVLLRRGERSHLWSCEIHAPAASGPHEQSRMLLDRYVSHAKEHGASLLDHVVRTWLYVADIYDNYAGLVEARRELFEAHGLTDETHYISSTGIEGRRRDPACLVSLDAYAIPGLSPEQVRYLVAPERLGPASAYGPTFERGTRVDHGDRAHVLISGTASIDPSGEVVHEGDVENQADRTLGNVEALLEDGGASLDDVVHMVVYVRDAPDHAAVGRFLDARCPGIPRILAEAPVCRPGWLVEIECMAVVANDDARWPAY